MKISQQMTILSFICEVYEFPNFSVGLRTLFSLFINESKRTCSNDRLLRRAAERNALNVLACKEERLSRSRHSSSIPSTISPVQAHDVFTFNNQQLSFFTDFTMATALCARRLTKELRSLQKDPIESPKISVQPNEANILEIHYVIEGSDNTPYAGGIYWGKLIFPSNYPLKPPSVMMITPSGRFQPERRLCLSMSDFHPETWNPLWSVSTILTGLYSFMIETSSTVGSIETSTSQKLEFARQSLAFNVRDPAFCKLFPQYVELHRKRLEERQASLGISGPLNSTGTGMLEQKAAMENADNGGIQALFTTAAGVVAIFSAVVLAMRFL